MGPYVFLCIKEDKPYRGHGCAPWPLEVVYLLVQGATQHATALGIDTSNKSNEPERHSAYISASSLQKL